MSATRRSAPASAVVALLDALEAIGGDGKAALKSAGLRYRICDLRDGQVSYVPRSSFARFSQECVLQFEEHGCRRDARPRFPVDRLKMLCLIASACPTLDIAIAMVIEFHRIAMAETRMLSLDINDDVATLTMDIPLKERRVGDLLVTMYGLTMFHRLFGWLTGEEIRLTGVTLAYPSALEVPAFNELLQLRPVFDASHDSIAFPAACLARPIMQNFQDIDRLFALFPFDLLPPNYDKGQLSDHIRVALRAALARRESLPGLTDLATMFGLSAATLRRRISSEDTTLVHLRESCRRDVAYDLLLGSNLSIKNIASRLQYCDSATFRRAFRKWTGHSPSEFRNMEANSSATAQFPSIALTH